MTEPVASAVPSTEEMVGWIEAVCAQGIRRPGSPADQWSERFVIERFSEAGLDDVHLEPVALPKWEPRTWSLEVRGAEGSRQLECFPLPHSAPAPDGVEATIGSSAGDVFVDTCTLNQLPQSFVRDRLAIGHHDPDGEFDDLVQVLPFGRNMQAVMEPAIDAGAVGFIGIFDAPWETCDYYVPYDGVERPIPGVWISKSSGEALNAMLEAGPVTARIVVDSTREQITTHNVIGTLPGASDEWVVIGSHHDGPWISAVEDASGIALVCAQAHYWSKIPAADRPHNLLFLVTSGHMVHGSGTAAFLEQHADMLNSIVLEVHLEHTARECKGEDGELVVTDAPEVRWWFTSLNDDLIASVLDALQQENVGRSLIMPPEVFAPNPTTDGGFFHLKDVPLVNFLAAPMYLFDSQDTPDKIHEASLEPITRAAIRIIASTAGVSAGRMRAGVTPPIR
jgi:hypothetical protein